MCLLLVNTGSQNVLTSLWPRQERFVRSKAGQGVRGGDNELRNLLWRTSSKVRIKRRPRCQGG